MNGWFLYDGECGFCLKWVRRLGPILKSRGFTPEPLQTPWVAERLKMPLSELLHDVRLLTQDGHLYSGADAYLYVAKKVWWAVPFAWLFSLPGFHGLLAAAYRKVAQNRYCISGKCQLPSR